MGVIQPFTIDPNDPPTFEKVWAALEALGERLDRSAREADRRQEEIDRRQEEIDRWRQEEADRRREEADQRQKEAAQRREEADRRWREEAARRREETAQRQKEAARRQKEADQRQKEADRQREEADRRWREEAARRREETAQRQKEAARRQKEADQRQKERWEKIDRQIEETNQQMKETDRRVGELTNRFGDMVEYMVVPNLVSKFRALGFTFEQSAKDVVIRDEKHGIYTEIDAFLQNGDKVMVVEIKATPREKDIDEHIERMELLRKYADLRNDSRKYRGAIAGAVFADSVRNYALKHGFYVVVPSGDTFDIIEPEGNYHVKEW